MMLPSVADKGADVLKFVRSLPLQPCTLCHSSFRRAVSSPLLPCAQRFVAMNLVSGFCVSFASWLFVTLLRRRRILHI